MFDTNSIDPDQQSLARARYSRGATLLLRSVLLAWVLAVVGTGAGALAAPGEPEDEQARLARLAEYEGLLAQTLPLEQSLCIDDLLRARWPKAADPSAAQWDQMLEQAIGAREQCASAGGETVRAASAIRRGMALQVERQRVLEERRAQLRACAARSNASNPAQGCNADELGKFLTPVQWSRVLHATLLGQRQ